MSSVTQAESINSTATRTLRTQKVDKVASLLMSLLIIIGLIVFLLFVIWLTTTFTWGPGDIEIAEERVAGRGDHAEGFERDVEPPGSEEVEQLSEPTLETTLEAVTDIATNVAAAIETVDTNSISTVTGSGKGDSRPPGPLGEGDSVIPRYERWELKFQAKDVKGYAAQLDYFGIELGCIGKTRLVDYASGFAAAPQKRNGKGSEEKRLYFMWRQEGPLVAFDRQLLGQAGVATEGRQLLKFISKDLEERLYKTEMTYAISKGHKSVKEIAKTIFESQPTSSGYDFVVVAQRYLPAPAKK
jgi:hypothetical protein